MSKLKFRWTKKCSVYWWYILIIMKITDRKSWNCLRKKKISKSENLKKKFIQEKLPYFENLGLLALGLSWTSYYDLILLNFFDILRSPFQDSYPFRKKPVFFNVVHHLDKIQRLINSLIFKFFFNITNPVPKKRLASYSANPDPSVSFSCYFGDQKHRCKSVAQLNILPGLNVHLNVKQTRAKNKNKKQIYK
ncbi:hypothetical protein BpHYR1_037588 [Brachionus plicatilis]|uniref:Uncharacterized protein n=1 Tax=Brachionus plicatilis TaxID=10195 RepID=A0A3M7SBQ2_BRAPC|nr:hypothetical protein BpHYR1_037588 [Brachionus plicatilis]